MSIENFKNPWVDEWKRGGKLHPDWLGQNKALEINNNSEDAIQTNTTIENLKKLMVSGPMKDGFKYLVNYSPTFVAFLAKFDNPKLFEGKIRLILQNVIAQSYFGSVQMFYKKQNLKSIETVPEKINLDTIHIQLDFAENRMDPVDPSKHFFRIIADTIVTLTHEFTLHLDADVQRINSSRISYQETPPIFLSGTRLLKTYKDFLANDSDHKQLKMSLVPLYDTVKNEVIAGLKKLTNVYVYYYKKDPNTKENIQVFLTREDVGLKVDQNQSGSTAKNKVHLWEYVDFFFDFDAYGLFPNSKE
jgi:hypothetical protein